MSLPSFEEHKVTDILWSNKENSDQGNNDGYNLAAAKQSSFHGPQASRAVGSAIQAVSTLSYRDLPIPTTTTRQLLEAIRIHHDRNFIQPVNESCMKRLPSCILVGVSKCGTKELLDFLNLHPNIETYSHGEMPYFNNKYKLGVEWLQKQMPCTYSNQITLMKHAKYFHDPAVPERIKKFNNSVKLILMVREPVSRSISRFMFDRYKKSKKHMEYAKNNFSSFVLNSNGDVSKTSFVVQQSVYDKPMKLWLKYFDLSQFLIMDNEELKHDPVSALNKVERFLGLERFITDEMFVLNKDKGFYCIKSYITDTGMACYPEKRGQKNQTVVSEETLVKLSDYFKSKNKHFFEIIGQTFDWKWGSRT